MSRLQNRADLIMNNHRKQLKKLGQDVEEFEKKLTKVIKGKDDGKVTSGQRERSNTSPSQGVSTRPKPSTFNSLKTNSKKQFNPKDQRRINSATVEVTVKAKGLDKSKKITSKNSTVYTLPCNALSAKKPQPVPFQNGKNAGHCCCLPSPKMSKNVIWSNILKQSLNGSPRFSVVESKEFAMAKTGLTKNHKNMTDNKKTGSEGLCRQGSSSKVNPEATSIHNISSEDIDTNSSEASCVGYLDGKIWHNKKENSNRLGSEIESGAKPKAKNTFNNTELSDSKSSLPMKPIETLQFLIEELHKKVSNVDDEPTRKLVNDMQSTLEKMSRATLSPSETSYRSKLSSRKSTARKLDVNSSSKNNLETEPKVNVTSQQPTSHAIDEQFLVTQPDYNEPDYNEDNNNKMFNDAASKVIRKYPEMVINDSVDRNDHSELPKRTFSTGDKFELPMKLNDDKGTQKHVSVGGEEKLKTEIECLKKQFDLQLKSFDSVTAKESEYQTLITSLVNKVKKLEDQVNEQTKAAQHFFVQSNMLLEQNSIIPVMQTSQDHLNKRLQETLCNYEKLKTDYCMLKLEKEKYSVLNREKDKEMNKFKEEIMNIQLLVAQQMENVKNFEGFASASEKVDTLMHIIDSQSNVIKSRIKTVKNENGQYMSPTESPTSSQSNSSPRPSSPVSISPKRGMNYQSGDIMGLPGNIARGCIHDCYSLSVPDLYSPHLSL